MLPSHFHLCIQEMFAAKYFSSVKASVTFIVLTEGRIFDTLCHAIVVINDNSLQKQSDLMKAAGEEMIKRCEDAQKPVSLPLVTQGGICVLTT